MRRQDYSSKYLIIHQLPLTKYLKTHKMLKLHKNRPKVNSHLSVMELGLSYRYPESFVSSSLFSFIKAETSFSRALNSAWSLIISISSFSLLFSVRISFISEISFIYSSASIIDNRRFPTVYGKVVPHLTHWNIPTLRSFNIPYLVGSSSTFQILEGVLFSVLHSGQLANFNLKEFVWSTRKRLCNHSKKSSDILNWL